MRTFNLNEAVPILPGDLADLLVRIAYLAHRAQQLDQHRNEYAQHLETVRATQPPFLFLHAKETRIAFKTATRATSTELTAIDRALTINKRLTAHLRAQSEDLLEKWLRVHCDEYRLGLASGHYLTDWENALDRFTDNARLFIQALGSARNMAPAAYDHVKGVFSQSTYNAIDIAQSAALKVEGEIVATNAIATEHDNFLGTTVFKDPMPRLVLEPYAAVVAKIASLPPTNAQTEFNRVIAAVEDLLSRELVALRARVRTSAEDHVGRTHSYVREAWNQLYAHAAAHSIEPEQVTAVIEQTERDYMVNGSLVLA
ncbi:MAG: hypothetical protein WC205_02175 [Opitutaceae bacterium]|jgi:hypothetical protein